VEFAAVSRAYWSAARRVRNGLADHAQACYGGSVGKSMKGVGLAVAQKDSWLKSRLTNKEIPAKVSVSNQEERRMSHFVTLIRYTQQGVAKIKESPARLDAAKKAAEKAGGKIHAWYLTMGKYDAVIISEFPNDEASAKFMLATGALGNVTTQTMKAFTEGEYRNIVASL